MPKRNPVRVADLRGYGRLAVEATLGLTELVENLHHNILRTPGILATPTQAPTKGITGLVYKTIRGVTRLVGGGIDVALAQVVPWFGAATSASSPEREAVLAALNGVLGDHLAASGNPLAVTMQLRRDGRVLSLNRDDLSAAIPNPTSKILLLVHGLCMNDLEWRRHAHDHGAALAHDAGYTPVYLHYNTGLHISSNGRELAGLIEELVGAWPHPVRELSILAHSMGGLVARSACHYAQAGRTWPRQLRKILFLGTPHHGAPLERGGNWVDAILGASPYTAAFARLGKIRSAGITDLRYGSVTEDDWIDRDRFARARRKPLFCALPEDVACYAIAASIAAKSGSLRERLLGDGLVPVHSALGQHDDAQRCLHFPKAHLWIGYRMHHMDLLDSKQVYAKMRDWFSAGH